MKIYWYLLSIFIYAAASLLAMQPPAQKVKIDPEEIRIVEYDDAKHHKSAKRLYKTAFDDSSFIKKMRNNPNARIDILEHNSQTTAIAIYCHALVAINKLFCDASTNTEQIKVCGLEKIIVSPEQQGKGLGATLMAHIEQEAVQHEDDMITLNAIGDTSEFYEKHGFVMTTFQSSTDNDDGAEYIEMIKPLNEKASLILQHVIDHRLKKATQ